MVQQPDTISFQGSLGRETFPLSRHQSVCSIHGHEKILSRKVLNNRHSALKLENYHNGHHNRFNSSFHHVRYIIVFFGGLAVGFMSLLRLNVTVAILNMVNQTQIYLEENPNGDLEQFFDEGYDEVGEFEWDNEKQQTIISYYMLAYTLPQLLTTKLAIKMGVKWSIPLSIGLCALSCLLTPILAYQGWQYVTLLRLVNGLGASAILPLMVHLIELWMPARESSLGLAIVQFVQSILFTLSPLISGVLADIHWKWAFYVPSIASLIFCLMWLCLVSDTPSDCWLISQAELDTICGCKNIIRKLTDLESSGIDQQSQPQLNYITKKDSIFDVATGGGNITNGAINNDTKLQHVNGYEQQQQAEQEEPVSSWTFALRYKSFYALTAVWIFYCSSFGSFSFLIPSYMRQVLKVPIMENGMLCFIIQCGCMLSVIWPQPILHILQNKCKFSLTCSRRIVLAFICFLAIITWILVACYHQYQVLLFSINRVFHLSTDTLVTATIMSYYSKTGASSIVYSVINAIGNLSTVFFCMAVGQFLDISGQSRECWSWVFVAMSLMNVAVVLLFSTVISSEPIELDYDDKKPRNYQATFAECKIGGITSDYHNNNKHNNRISKS